MPGRRAALDTKLPQEEAPKTPVGLRRQRLRAVVESHVGRAFWLSQTEHFLDAAIRLAPAGPFAEDASSVLEEFVLSGYTGSSGSDVPEEVGRRLAELRALIDAAPDS